MVTIGDILKVSQKLKALKCEISKVVRISFLIRGLSNIYDTILAAYIVNETLEISDLSVWSSEEIRLHQHNGEHRYRESAQVMMSRVHDNKKDVGFRLKQDNKFQPKTRGQTDSCYECG